MFQFIRHRHFRIWQTNINFWLFLFLLSGCATAPNHFEKVSAEVEQRTGRALKDKTAEDFEVPLGIAWDDGLSEDEAVALALWNNAVLQETLSDLQISRAELLQASMVPNPSLIMLVPVGTKPLELTANYPIEFFWLRPRRVASAKLDYEKTSARLVQNAIDLVRNVKIACAEAFLADRRTGLLEESTRLHLKIEDLAKARAAAGEASELETATATADTLQMREQLARSRYDTKVARERLNNLLGFGLKTFSGPIIEPQLPVCKEYEAAVLVTNALAGRPDLRSAGLAIEAAGKRVGLAKSDILTFRAGLNSKEVGSDFLSGPAFDLTVPVFNQNQGNIALAKANLEKAARSYLVIRDRVILEVREAQSRLQQAQESVETWQKQILPPLRENVEQTQKAYELGEISFLMILEASRKLADAEMKAATANAEVHRAFAELERSVGGRLIKPK